jgi:hypothetical protein
VVAAAMSIEEIGVVEEVAVAVHPLNTRIREGVVLVNQKTTA